MGGVRPRGDLVLNRGFIKNHNQKARDNQPYGNGKVSRVFRLAGPQESGWLYLHLMKIQIFNTNKQKAFSDFCLFVTYYSHIFANTA